MELLYHQALEDHALFEDITLLDEWEGQVWGRAGEHTVPFPPPPFSHLSSLLRGMGMSVESEDELVSLLFPLWVQSTKSE